MTAIFTISESGICPKCTTFSGNASNIVYIPAREAVAYCGLEAKPEHIRVICVGCGYSVERPTADAVP